MDLYPSAYPTSWKSWARRLPCAAQDGGCIHRSHRQFRPNQALEFEPGKPLIPRRSQVQDLPTLGKPSSPQLETIAVTENNETHLEDKANDLSKGQFAALVLVTTIAGTALLVLLWAMLAPTGGY